MNENNNMVQPMSVAPMAHEVGKSNSGVKFVLIFLIFIFGFIAGLGLMYAINNQGGTDDSADKDTISTEIGNEDENDSDISEEDEPEEGKYDVLVKFASSESEFSFKTEEEYTLIEDGTTGYSLTKDEQEVLSIRIVSKTDLDDFTASEEDQTYPEKALSYYSANQCSMFDKFVEETVLGNVFTFGSVKDIPDETELDQICTKSIYESTGAAIEFEEEYIIVVVDIGGDDGVLQEFVDTYSIK